MSLKLKTILGVALIEAVLLAVLVTLTLSYLRSTNFEGLTRRGESTASLFASTVKDAVLSYDLASLEAFTAELMTNPDLLYVRVIDGQGRPLSLRGDASHAAVFHKPEPGAAEVTDGVFDVVHPISESGINYGQVQIGFDMSRLNQQINQAQRWSAFIVLGEMTLVALFSYVLGTFLTRRLGRLQEATELLAAGQRNVSLDEKGQDEVARVAAAFNNMVQKLQRSEQTTISYQNRLEQMNTSLENKVRQRTAELHEKNAKLEQTNLELKNTQAKLIQSEKMAAIGTMASGYAHEINNPLGAADSNLQLCEEYLSQYQELVARIKELTTACPEQNPQLTKLLSGEELSFLEQDFSESLTDARNNTRRVQTIINGLKNYSHFENQHQENLVSLEEVLKSALAESQILCDCAGYQLDVKNSASLKKGNRAELQQALVNIMKNACQAISGTRDGVISIELVATSSQACITVSDNGPGMDPAHIRKVFDPFYTTRQVGQGSGLGLTHSRNVIEQHKGNIEVSSQPGMGTKVRITFPGSEIADVREVKGIS